MLTEIARRAAVDFADTLAYETDDGTSITYAELDRAADEAAAGMEQHGAGPGSVVALVLPSRIDYLVLYLAIERIGAVTAGLNPKLRPREISSCLEVIRPDLVVHTPELAEGIDPQLPAEVLVPGEDAATFGGRFRVAGAEPYPAPPDDDERPICICFTSGSTGRPKGAWYTNRQLRAIAELDTGGAWGTGGHSFASTQFAHVGFMTKWPWLLASGGTTHILDRWSAAPVLRLVARYKMAAIPSVAPQIALMLQHPLVDELDFSSVKAIVAGGSASPPALVREARRRFGCAYSIRYSSTESGGVGLGTAIDADDEEALHTIGRPRPGVEASIRTHEGEAVPDGEIGELWLSSPTVMSGYWNDPDETAATLVDGWLRTGDLAYVDPAGCYRLAGRFKEMFIRGGYNVYPLEVEAVLSDHPGIADIALVPRPDPVMGEIGVAVVIPADHDDPPTLESVREFGTDQLAHYKLPEAIRVVETFPRNASDKTDRRVLAAVEADHPTG